MRMRILGGVVLCCVFVKQCISTRYTTDINSERTNREWQFGRCRLHKNRGYIQKCKNHLHKQEKKKEYKEYRRRAAAAAAAAKKKKETGEMFTIF